MSLYSDIQFMRLRTDRSVLTEIVVERLAKQRVPLAFRARFPVKLGEDFISDSVCLHRLLDLLGAGVVARLATFEVVVKLFELVYLLFAEPDRWDSGSVGHASRLAGSRIKREVTT